VGDIYSLDKNALAALEGKGEKSASKLLNKLKKARTGRWQDTLRAGNTACR
jgi:NAD-dependent DNA ligase